MTQWAGSQGSFSYVFPVAISIVAVHLNNMKIPILRLTLKKEEFE